MKSIPLDPLPFLLEGRVPGGVGGTFERLENSQGRKTEQEEKAKGRREKGTRDPHGMGLGKGEGAQG